MKLLLDQNLSWKLVALLEPEFPGSVHVEQAISMSADDGEIWRFARKNGLVIVSKDDDFEQQSFLRGHPPKVIRVRLGNCTTDTIFQLLIKNREVIRSFGEDGEKSLLIIP